MLLDNIGFYTLTEQRVAQASSTSPLQRCELILTDQCNFHCPYCRGLPNGCEGEVSFAFASSLVSSWAQHDLRNVRFSGGEPTLWDGLVDLVTYSKSRGIKRIAISTNGSASFSTYQKLIDAGANDFSVSLDACCASTGETLCGVQGAWEHVLKSIEYLAKRVYTTVGIVLVQENEASVFKTITLAHGLGVADIRVIPAAQYQASLASPQLVNGFLSNHPILKYRVERAKADLPVRGLSTRDSHSCPLVMDDMAVSGQWHFPCIIYLREGGKPIGRVGGMKQMREERRLWCREHDTHEDKICSKNCLDVCVAYNNRWKELHSYQVETGVNHG